MHPKCLKGFVYFDVFVFHYSCFLKMQLKRTNRVFKDFIDKILLNNARIIILSMQLTVVIYKTDKQNMALMLCNSLNNVSNG